MPQLSTTSRVAAPSVHLREMPLVPVPMIRWPQPTGRRVAEQSENRDPEEGDFQKTSLRLTTSARSRGNSAVRLRGFRR
jgi:hypothetical protein